MREPTDLNRSRAPRSRARSVLIALVATVIVGLMVLWNSAGIYTDYLWFDSVDHTTVWSRIFRTRVGLGVSFTALFFVVLWVNLWLADRMAPQYLGGGPEDDMLQRYQELFAGSSGRMRTTVSLLFALIAGAGVSSRWTEWMLFRNAVEFGEVDPLHGVDLGFYLFQLPLLSFVIDWAFASMIIILIITAIGHYLNGGIRLQQPMQRVTPQVKAHLSVLLAVLALIRGFDYWLQRFELTISTRATVDGALFTDVNTKLPALSLMMLISLLAFGLFLYNIRRRGWALPVIAVGLWAFVAIVVGTVYPAVTQRFRVEPDESTREAPFIDRNIEATRFGLGLDSIDVGEGIEGETQPFSQGAAQSSEQLLDQLVLLDPAIVLANVQAEESSRQFYRFRDVDVDRYTVDGEEVPVVLSVRELDQDKLPGPGWEAQHITYTHGYGVVMAPANRPGRDGNPDAIVSDIPIEIDDRLSGSIVTQPRVYFGEGMRSYAIVKTGRPETDGSGDTSPYEGTGGVELGSNFRQAAFALRFGDLNLLISEFVNDGSEILYVRDVRERVSKVAPFLAFDSDPYVALVDGRVNYVVDGYTTSARLPYSQRADVSDLSGSSGIRRRLNYVRNPVKAVVDAYDGSVTLYAIDEGQDPIIDVWRGAFPGLFDSFDDMPAELTDHLRYPTDLFRVQSNMFGRYRLDDSQDFYDQANAWVVAQDPGDTQLGRSATTESIDGVLTTTTRRSIDSSYYMYQLPEDEAPEFSLVRSFVRASSRTDNSNDPRLLTGLIVGRSSSDDGGYNRLRIVPTPSLPAGPSIVQARLSEDGEISRQLSLLDDTGSDVKFGDMLILPVDESILYVRPVFTITQSDAKVPQLEFVMLSDGRTEVMSETVDGALAMLLANSDQPVSASGDDPPVVGATGDAAEAIAAVREALAELERQLGELESELTEEEADQIDAESDAVDEAESEEADLEEAAEE